MSNPLLSHEFRIPFDQIQAAHVRPAVQQLLAECRDAAQKLAGSPGPRTYENTLEIFDRLTERLEYAVNVTRHLESVTTYPELREAYNEIQGPVTEFYTNLLLDEGLWRVLREYASTRDARSLTGARKRYLEKTLSAFRRNGAELDAAGKEKLRQLDIELAMTTTKFGENVLDSTNQFELILTEESDLAGLPESAIEAARQSARSKGREGWRFTLQAPSYLALMTYLDRRDIREQVYRAYNRRAAEGEFDNHELTLKILQLRKQKAQLLGYVDFADYVLEERMAKNGKAAREFLENLRGKTGPFFARENQELLAFSGQTALEPWDISYWAEKQRKALFDFDEEDLRPYFSLDAVMKGMFELFAGLFGIRVKEQADVPGWDPEVKYYRIETEEGLFLGGFYADWYPRENKRGGAWMDSLITGAPDAGEPHLGLICGNLTPPVGDKPSLLTHSEVETVFHEFGHLLHHCLSRVAVRSLAGTNVAWDFVELPSQILENWCWERESLDLFARHYRTGARIPDDLFAKMIRAKNYRSANLQMRQLSFGLLDLALHCEYDAQRDGDIVLYSRAILDQFSAAKLPEGHAMILSFTHLFANPVGYGAGYYSYKWSEVLDADAFTRFQADGLRNPQVGAAFRDHILAKGDSEDPADLYRAFMGRDPDVNALLIRSGLAG
jgi:oligopeptidase A